MCIQPPTRASSEKQKKTNKKHHVVQPSLIQHYTRLTRTAHDVFIRVFCGIRDTLLLTSSPSSTIAVILRSAEVFRVSVCVFHAKLRFQYFLRKTILCQKKFFVAVHDLYDNMKAWTVLLNNRTLR